MRPWEKIAPDRPFGKSSLPFGNTRRHEPRYHNARWRHLRTAVLNRDGGVCAVCGRKAVIVDHINPLTIDASDVAFYSMDNLQCLCRVCHQDKTNREIANRKKNGSV